VMGVMAILCTDGTCVFGAETFFLDEEGSIVVGDTTGVGSNGTILEVE
jgi:hypothetical protein